MEAKLIKTKQELIVNYHLKNENGHTIATTLFPVPTEVEYAAKSRGITLQRLSHENCEAIERNFDLVDHAIAYAGEGGRYCDPHGFSDKQIGLLQGYIDGFEKALELMGDKKFSEEDVRKAIEQARETVRGEFLKWDKSIIQSLQQTEWDVEIEMGKVESYKDKMGNVRTEKTFPTLDADGCLILKLKSE
jgi:hypothetical protein